MIAVGLMSGTSLDGIDAALVRLRPNGAGYKVDLLNFATFPIPPELLNDLRAALPPNAGTAAGIAALDRRLGDAFARAALAVSGDMPLDFIASHGQTIYHDGDAGYTMQAGDPFVIREKAGCTVCFDFRRADCAAGGQGAPLVPYVDALLFADANEDRVAVNIGGIANLTVVRAGALPQDVVAFDSGPGNMLIDAFVRARTNGEQTFDRGGAFAKAGSVDGPLLQAMLEDPYFALAPPKSTGRERFGAQFLEQHAARLEALSLENGCATLAALTARSLAHAISAASPPGARVFVSGGGVHNAFLMEELARSLPGFTVVSASVHNVHADAKEAVAFAVLGYELLRERPANVPGVTGARGPVVLGSLAPHDLRTLLAKVQAECRT
ncbi:MAG TPA: anhydro-N-acetylmuramic acid kinase [Candidatus Baltobacteraceae bacterium]|nr:anhydro-N-acetylmuramic acid kinase [Candidatus Baltobacteraceae bacterium]